jgi:hypothetical protein
MLLQRNERLLLLRLATLQNPLTQRTQRRKKSIHSGQAYWAFQPAVLSLFDLSPFFSVFSVLKLFFRETQAYVDWRGVVQFLKARMFVAE